jgi:hypothetical protein
MQGAFDPNNVCAEGIRAFCRVCVKAAVMSERAGWSR